MKIQVDGHGFRIEVDPLNKHKKYLNLHYSGVNRLKKTSKTTLKDTLKWLQTQDTYTLHKPIQRKFKRCHVIVGGINQQVQADLINVRNLKSTNRSNISSNNN